MGVATRRAVLVSRKIEQGLIDGRVEVFPKMIVKATASDLAVAKSD